MAEGQRPKKQRNDVSDAPKHKRIADEILVEIEEGRWTPGAQIPSEDQLATEIGASVGTVRRALLNLVEMGVLERHHGKGTFVSGARAPERHLRHFRFVAEGSTDLLPAYFRILEVEETTASGPWASHLTTSPGRFVRISRIVSVNNEFDVFSEVYLPGDRFGEIARMGEGLNGVSIRDLLAERFNAPTLRTYQLMNCAPLPPRVTRVIKVPAGQYGVILTICGHSYRDAPISWQRIFIPPSDRDLEISSLPRIEQVL